MTSPIDQQSAVPVIFVASPRATTRMSGQRQKTVLVLVVLMLGTVAAFLAFQGTVAALLAFQDRAKKRAAVPRMNEPREFQKVEPLVLGDSRPAEVDADREDIIPPAAPPRQPVRNVRKSKVWPPPQPKPKPKVVNDVPSEVTLPPTNGPSFRLAGLPHDEIGNVQLKLFSLNQPGKVTRIYFYIPREGMGEAWEVYFDNEDAQRLLPQGGPLPEGISHARFTYEHGELFFNWLPAAVENTSATNLRNSVLEIRGNDFAAEIQLRSTVVDESPILVDGWKDIFAWKIERRDLDPLPRDEDLRLEVDARNFPRLELKEGNPEAAAEGEQLKWTIGNHSFAGLAIAWEHRLQILRVHIGPAYELSSFPGELYPLSPKQVDAHETTLASRIRSSEIAKQRAQCRWKCYATI